MNKFQGNIADIETSGNLSIVSVAITDDILLKAIVFDTPATADYLILNGSIFVLFKETEVVMAIGEEHNISLQNRIPGTIRSIETGKLISKVTLDSEAGVVASIISSNAVSQLGLEAGKQAIAMIKLNEVMLSDS